MDNNETSLSDGFSAFSESEITFNDTSGSGSEPTNEFDSFNTQEIVETEFESGSTTDESSTTEVQGGSIEGETQETLETPVTEESKTPESIPAYKALSEKTGLLFNSDEDLESALKEYDQLKKADPYEKLSPEIQEAIKFQKAGGDLAQYFQLKSQNFDTMGEKDVLRNSFMKENATLAKENPKLAELKFKRSYAERFGILDKTFEDDYDRDEWMAANQEELELAKEEYSYEVKLAREQMKSWQAQSTTPPVKDATDDVDKSEQLRSQYLENASKAIQNFKHIHLAVGDKAEETFSLGINDGIKGQVENWVKNPAELLKVMGIGEDGIDTSKLMEAAVLLASKDSLGKKMKDHVLKTYNRETIEGKLENPRKVTQGATGTPARSLAEELADAVVARRGW